MNAPPPATRIRLLLGLLAAAIAPLWLALQEILPTDPQPAADMSVPQAPRAHAIALPPADPATPPRASTSRVAFERTPGAPRAAMTQLAVHVIDTNLQPIAGAKVELWPAKNPNPVAAEPTAALLTGTTDRDGYCAFTIEPALWRLRAHHDQHGCTDFVPADWPAIRTQGAMELRVWGLGRIRGVVTDGEGHVYPGARVHCRPGRYGGEQADIVLTDPSGAFELQVRANERLELWAAHPAGSSEGSPCHVAPGAELWCPLLLRPRALLSGSILGADGAPAAGVQVELERDGASAGVQLADARGAFRFELREAGDYELVASDQGTRVLEQRVHVAAGANRIEVRLQLARSPSIEGTLLAPDGAPLRRGTVMARLLGAGDAPTNPWRWTTDLQSSGRFELRNLKAPGRYELLFLVPRSDHARAVIRRELDAGTRGLELHLTPQELTGAEVTVEVRLQDGQREPILDLELYRRPPAEPWQIWLRHLCTLERESGTVRIRGLPPGETFVVRVPGSTRESEPFVVEHGKQVVIRPRQPARLRVVLLDAAGQPLDPPVARLPNETMQELAERTRQARRVREWRLEHIDSVAPAQVVPWVMRGSSYDGFLVPPGRYRLRMALGGGRRIIAAKFTLGPGQEFTQTVIVP